MRCSTDSVSVLLILLCSGKAGNQGSRWWGAQSTALKSSPFFLGVSRQGEGTPGKALGVMSRAAVFGEV